MKAGLPCCSIDMLMAKERISPPNLHGPDFIQTGSQVFPCGGKTLGIMLVSVFLVLVLSVYCPEQSFLYSPMPPTHSSHQKAITSMLLLSLFPFVQNCQYSFVLCTRCL
ncbi:hypothetical protein GUJ93_ZPchr0014g47283 [Zizania palustris]|uniref:Uncharacterized protein n=1 Tax=Zizania palustris TaxID=103762 RepID=A0A8J5THC0_ZIZPA|nr:hypothetical protein GUJ93_ZPchr0014g47283 [Zizania palustris]